MNKNLIAQLVLLFLLTQVLGLLVGDFLINQGIHTTLLNDNPNDVANSLGLFVWIIVFTGFLLALIKFAPDWLFSILIKGIEIMAIFGTTIVVLLPFVPYDEIIKAFAAAIILVALRIILAKNLLLRNITSIIAAAGAGSLIGASLGVMPMLVFVVLLSAYDFIAVFKTKHMVTLAKGITKKNLSFTYAMPTKGHQFELGTGDMIIPLAFAVSILGEAKTALAYPYFFVSPALVLFVSLIGLIFTIDFASKKSGRALPALPFQVILMLIVWGITKAAGY